MSDPMEVDLAVIGAGSGGLSVSAGAAQMGANVVLIERDRMGGDCLNVGCVPSKSIIKAAHVAQTVREGSRYGVNGHEPAVDFARVHAHVHGVIAAIAPHDSVERFESLGVKVIRASARFVGPREVEAGGRRIRARRVVVATGSRAAVPPVPGLAETPFLTNETIFDLTEAPEHLFVLGGGPIGIEMAQAHRRLGSRVTVLNRGSILPRDEPEAVDVVRRRLVAEGVDLRENAKVASVARHGNGVVVAMSDASGERRIEASHLLVAAGRQPNIEDLDLPAAGVESTAKGITVDARLRSVSNSRVFAIGDVAGGYQFTHVAGYHAGIVIRNALFRMPAKVDYRAVPWVTYTDPELAHVGLTEAEARQAGHDVTVLTWPFEEVDRAQAERETEGFAKAIVDKRGRILGATVVGLHAGELIQTWVLAIQEKIGIGRIAQMIAPYPTLGEVNKRVAGSYYTPKLFSSRTRRVVRLLGHLG